MGMLNKFKDMIGVSEEYDEEYAYDDEYDDYYEEETESEGSAAAGSRRSDKVVTMRERKVSAVSSDFKLMIIEPEGLEECSRLVDGLKNRKPVIVNLEQLDSETARKIYDFLGGATYALDGNVRKIANNIYVFAPQNVELDTNAPAENAGGTMPSFIGGGSDEEDYNPWR